MEGGKEVEREQRREGGNTGAKKEGRRERGD